MTDSRPPAAQGPDAPSEVPRVVRHPPFLLWAAGAVALGVLILVILGATIDRGHQFAFDRAILLAMRHATDPRLPVGPGWLEPAMIDLTALGGTTVLTLIVTLTTGLLLLRRRWVTVMLVLAATITGSIAVDLAKTWVGRPRPTVIDHLVEVSSLSFPSGHSANSAIVYLTLATLIAQIVEPRAVRYFVIAVAVLLVTMIGCSRVYLGVHWPSDVLAGWSFGILWALAWWAIGARVRLRRAGE